ncbi:ferrous iron transport protein B [Candidatus Cetobacterium colombiensis]|uniref:Ferrous iron transport protein B n=1 Tax=Candidatus Cetobacterium colombiensis TaxID=3073100 RepID=A0ABU4W876_9FUSO|nr:ferrous iron transport protein B [Candidatus Cetobacterium colombiensis]MDX8335434.1 ferrous iron transport protein B [Candidatus Cetobacterium colombiensis]
MIKIAFTGNPNVGKSALINAIAGSNLKVGNWAGVTVEKKEAEFEYKGEKIQCIDLPGVYSLSPYTLEETITRDFIINEKPDVIINIVDSTNLERNLYLTMLLKELEKPMIMALNFYDEFEKLNYKLDMKKFTDMIEMDVVMTSAVKRTGIQELLDKALLIAKSNEKDKKYTLLFDQCLQNAIEEIKCKINCDERLVTASEKFGMDFLAIKLLEQDKHLLEILKSEYKYEIDASILATTNQLEEDHDEDIETIFAEGRYGTVKGILAKTFTTSIKSRLDFTDKVDRVLLNKYLGLPIFFLIIVGLMGTVFNGSAPLIDWVDGFVNNYIGKYVAMLIDENTPNWLASLVMDGILGGVGGVVVFVPLMLYLYFFLALLEESGYMSRVAFLMDKIMTKLGLNGKAFVPMVLGFGCTVPAIYATRTLEDESSRRLTAAMAPFMSCGARLPVYGLFTAAFFGAKAGMVVMSLYVLGIVVAILTGLILKNFDMFKAEGRALLIELPPYRVPSLRVIVKSTLTRTGSYLKKATTIIMGMLMILWALTYFPNNGDTANSYMAKFGKTFQGVLKPTGFADRWETVAAIPPSLAAKEIVVGFMAQVLVGDENAQEIEEATQETGFIQDTAEQLMGLGVAIKDSIVAVVSFDVKGLFTVPDAEEIEEEGSGVVSATKMLWTDELAPLRAYSFMVFILLVVPCVVTLGAIKQEFGYKFTGFIIGMLLVIPYVVSTLIFQVGKLFF